MKTYKITTSSKLFDDGRMAYGVWELRETTSICIGHYNRDDLKKFGFVAANEASFEMFTNKR